MAAFTYDAINAQGLQLKGEIHAADVASAQDQLHSRGLLAQNLVERRAKGEAGARTAFKKVKPKSLQVFFGVYDELHGKLPSLTQFVMAMSTALRHAWFVIFPAIAAIVFGLRRLKRTEKGRQVWDSFKLRIPVRIGDVVQKIALARMSRTLATLVAAGVDIISALEIASTTAGNWVIEQSLNHVRERVHEGVPIGEPLSSDPVFPPMLGQMVKIGEETGELEKMLGKVADFYEDEVDASIQSLTSIIEPVLMIGVGAMVGTIVISMYLPMFKMLTLIK